MKSKLGVQIIHGRTLYTGKYGTHVWTKRCWVLRIPAYFHKNSALVTAFFILNEYAAETRLLSVFQVCCQPCRERKTATFATRSHECFKESAEVALSSLNSDAISQISILWCWIGYRAFENIPQLFYNFVVFSRD